MSGSGGFARAARTGARGATAAPAVAPGTGCVASAISIAAAAAWLTAGCAHAPAPDYGARIERAQGELAEDPRVAARRAEVQAAIERERAETAIDDFQIRLGDTHRPDSENGHDHRVRLRTRIPIPLPGELDTRRSVRRAEIEAALSRLEESMLARSAELCLRDAEASELRALHEIHGNYTERYARLLERNEELRRAGRISEPAATRFEIESRIKLATRAPRSALPSAREPAPLPDLTAPRRRLVTRAEVVGQIVSEHHPGAAQRRAMSARYGALSERARHRGRPWPAFVDLDYEAAADSESREVGAQVAFRIPVGASTSAQAARYRSLERGELRDAEADLAQRVHLARIALYEIDDLERNAERWRELLALAGQAESEAERWWRAQLVSPAQVGALLDQAHAARSSVVGARERAAVAQCTILAATGVELPDWPRE